MLYSCAWPSSERKSALLSLTPPLALAPQEDLKVFLVSVIESVAASAAVWSILVPTNTGKLYRKQWLHIHIALSHA